ncbi:MAG: hypothetical protein VKL20_08430 [Synechocystis sp.]|nr:hypothetical protein [Synechocystis sp.]
MLIKHQAGTALGNPITPSLAKSQTEFLTVTVIGKDNDHLSGFLKIVEDRVAMMTDETCFPIQNAGTKFFVESRSPVPLGLPWDGDPLTDILKYVLSKAFLKII